MKSPFLILAAVVFAVGCISCQTSSVGIYTANGYSPRDAYYFGFAHGSQDRLRGDTHNPHINQPDVLPSAHRTEYIWGYNEGYKYPRARPDYSAVLRPSK